MRKDKLQALEEDSAKLQQFCVLIVLVLWKIHEKQGPCLMSFALEIGQVLHSSAAQLFETFYLLPHLQP